MQGESLNYTVIFLPDERVYGEIVSRGTYASKVRYMQDGFQYEIVMLNEDFEIVEEINIPEIEEI